MPCLSSNSTTFFSSCCLSVSVAQWQCSSYTKKAQSIMARFRHFEESHRKCRSPELEQSHCIRQYIHPNPSQQICA